MNCNGFSMDTEVTPSTLMFRPFKVQSSVQHPTEKLGLFLSDGRKTLLFLSWFWLPAIMSLCMEKLTFGQKETCASSTSHHSNPSGKFCLTGEKKNHSGAGLLPSKSQCGNSAGNWDSQRGTTISSITVSSQLITSFYVLSHNSTPFHINIIFLQECNVQTLLPPNHSCSVPAGWLPVASVHLLGTVLYKANNWALGNCKLAQVYYIPIPHVDPDCGTTESQKPRFYTQAYIPLVKWQK